MKTLKFALVAAIVACTMVSLANADGFKSKPKFKKMVSLTIEKAMQDPGLVTAMYNQIQEEDILYFPLPPYIFEVSYNGTLYRISGTRAQWIRFIWMKGVSPPNSKKSKLETE
jgi:hypothetical protein